jgi:hypothetical protein
MWHKIVPRRENVNGALKGNQKVLATAVGRLGVATQKFVIDVR